MSKRKTPRSFELVYKKIATPLAKFIAKRTRDPELTEEIFAQTIAAAWKGWNKFEHKSTYLTWLCRISLNKIADYYRGQIHERSVIVVPILEDLAGFKRPNPTPDELLVLEELKLSVNECLNLLPPEKRQLLQFRYWKDMSLKEISKVLGVSERAIEGRIYRAKKSLAKIAKERGLTLR